MSLDMSRHVGGNTPSLADYEVSKSSFERQGVIMSRVFDIQTPPSAQPRGYTSPRIRKIDPKSRLLKGTSPFSPSPPKSTRPSTSSGTYSPKRPAVAPATPSTPGGMAVGVEGSPGGRQHLADTPASRASTARPSTSGGGYLGDTAGLGTPSRGSQSARGPREGRQDGGIKPPRPVNFACSVARQRGNRMWDELAHNEFLNSYRDKVVKREESRRRAGGGKKSYQERLGSMLHYGSSMPVAWSPPPEPDRYDEPRSVFAHAAKETGVKYEPPKWKVGMTKKQAIASINSRQIQLQYTGGGAICRPLQQDSHEKRRRKPSKSQKIVGLHIKVGKELVHDRTKVVYSEHYYDSKKLDIPNDAWPEDPNPKYVGTIVDFDLDGLMTNVLWPDGSVEYCCTGYSNKFFIALVDRPEEEEVKMKKKMGKKDWKEEAAFSPKWTLQPSGMFSVPFKPKHRQIRTASQVAAAVKRLHSKLSKISDKDSEEYLAVDREYQIAGAELKEMNIDRESMASWIEVDVNGEHFKIAPSQLAPPASASLGTKQPSILSQVRKEVRREAEKERRRLRREEEAEAERKRLERKSIRSSIYAAELQQHNKRQEEIHRMDPWEAVSTASPDVLVDILREAYSLFDIDNSGTMDSIEFEQALSSLGIEVPQNLIQFVIADADKDGNGTLDWSEFKELATTMVEVSRVSKDKKQKKEKEQNRKAAARNEKVLIQQAKKDPSLREDSDEEAGASSSKPGGGKVVWGNLADAIFEDAPQDSVLQVVRTGSGSGPGSQRRGSVVSQNKDIHMGLAPDVPIKEGATSKHVLMAVLESNEERKKGNNSAEMKIASTVERLSRVGPGGAISRTSSGGGGISRTSSAGSMGRARS